MTVALWFVRCRDCLAAFTVTETVEKCTCGGSVEYIGQVKDKGVYGQRTACGARCQNATGPNCDCECRGANHGHAVLVEVFLGQAVNVPVSEARMADAVEWRAAVLDLLAARPASWMSTAWLERSEWWAKESFSKSLHAARKARTHKSRMVKLGEARDWLPGGGNQ